MTHEYTTTTSDIPDHEQAILDTALLESDQLLARSLHDDDQRRRRRWLLGLIIGGVVMSILLMAVFSGWIAISGQVVAQPDASRAVSEQVKQEDLAFQKRLLSATDDDPWHVGANIGMDLMRIPSDRPYKLLKANWQEIAVNARKQILKGFTPGMMGNKEMHANFFDVMDLGMTDKNAGVRSFAANYLKMQGLPHYERDLAAYKRWRAKTEKLTAKETMKLVENTPDEDLGSEALTAEGWKLWGAQRFAEAADKFSIAVKKDAKAVNAWNGLGWALFNSGQADKALPAFKKCIKLSSRHPGALNGLGQVYFSRKEYKLAEKYFKKAAPQASAAWWGLTKVYLLTGKFKQAVPWAEKVAAGSPNDPWAQRMLEEAKAGELSDELRQMIEPVVVAEKQTEADQSTVR